MSKVVHLDSYRPKHPEEVFTCATCGNQTFFLHRCGDVECRRCGMFPNELFVFNELDDEGEDDTTPTAA